ncbi:MAG: hypothetical protein ABI855_01450 [Bacteroidota bacterium]
MYLSPPYNKNKIGLMGPVKFLKEIEYKAIKDGEKIIKGEIAHDISDGPEYSELLFNNNGQMIEKKDFQFGNKQFYHKDMFFYNDFGQLILAESYDSENKLSEFRKYNYISDRWGNILETKCYSDDGNIWTHWKQTLQYDDKNIVKGKLINYITGFITYDNTSSTIVFKRDIFGNILEEVHTDNSYTHVSKFDSRGNLIEEDKIENNQSIDKDLYIYDHQNFLIEQLDFKNNNLFRRWKYKDFQVDTFNNWRSRTVYFHDEPCFVTERLILYF